MSVQRNYLPANYVPTARPTCPWCERSPLIRKDGRIAGHQFWPEAGGQAAQCPGSGRSPEYVAQMVSGWLEEMTPPTSP